MTDRIEDAMILNGTVAKPKDGILIAEFKLPNGDMFRGEFKDEEQMRKRARDWCETVRSHWDAIVARKQDPMPREESVVNKPRHKDTTMTSAQQMIINQYHSACAKIEDMEATMSLMQDEMSELEELRDELKPLVEKWGSP